MLTVDLAGICGAQEMHEALAQSLRFPDYYGYNWDAFFECIEDLHEDGWDEGKAHDSESSLCIAVCVSEGTLLAFGSDIIKLIDCVADENSQRLLDTKRPQIQLIFQSTPRMTSTERTNP